MKSGKPERMGGQRTFLLAAGAFLGVLAMSGIIHLVRRQTPIEKKQIE